MLDGRRWREEGHLRPGVRREQALALRTPPRPGRPFGDLQPRRILHPRREDGPDHVAPGARGDVPLEVVGAS